MAVDQIIALAVAALVSLAFVLVRILIDEIQSQKSPEERRRAIARSQPVNGKALQRIVAQLRKDYPDRSEAWYWQKAHRDYALSQTQAPPLNLTPPKSEPSRNPLELPKQPLRVVQTVDTHTQRKLFALVNGNRKVAARLLETTRDRNPSRSEQWCWEKVIYDLERDRRA